MTRQQIIDAVLECAEKLGHVPSHVELMKHSGVSRKQIRWHFGTYAGLLADCDLAGTGSGHKAELEDLFRDWAGIVRKLKKLPTMREYELESQYSVRPLVARFKSWRLVPLGMKAYAQQQSWAEEWKDVLAMVPSPELDIEEAIRAAGLHGPGDRKGAGRLVLQGPENTKNRRVQEVYGPILRRGPMVCAPTNEQGVILLFGAMAEALGFAVLKIGTEYPDCEAFLQVEEDRLERVKIEFEYESKNFLKHMHEKSKCDVLVCWKHNWPECPLDVVELNKLLPTLP